MTTIALPYPPSANRYLRHTARGTYRTAEADRYCAAVQQIAAASAAGKHKGRVSLIAKLHPKRTMAGKASKTRMDLDNCIKVACDALQGVLYDNDRQIERISIEIGAPMCGGALGPVNGRLVDTAFSTGWMNVAITSDMDITADGRAYSLLSESERWRVDAMIAETIAHLSGEKLLVLDRVDVLDVEGREDLLFWLDDLASSGEIDTCLLFATLKALPAKLPDNIEAVWIESGRATTAGKLKAA